MKARLARLVVLMLLSTPFTTLAGKDIVGWIENVRLYPGNLTIKAKLDTGAKTSSLNCTCSSSLKKKVQRIAKIRRHFGELQERYVVNVDICLAGHRKTIEATVIDREGFNYQMLIGRSALAGDFLLDPARTFTHKPECNIPAPPP